MDDFRKCVLSETGNAGPGPCRAHLGRDSS
jgi:hypothetical protein